MRVQQMVSIILLFTASVTSFIFTSIEMNKSRADHLSEQGFVSDSKKLSGVLDRLEKNQAIILLEDVKKQITIPKNQLPVGSIGNTWFHLVKEDGAFEIVSIDYEKTESEQMKAKKLIEALRE